MNYLFTIAITGLWLLPVAILLLMARCAAYGMNTDNHEKPIKENGHGPLR